jgi:tetratricopeptide (TPR) repeat protein
MKRNSPMTAILCAVLPALGSMSRASDGGDRERAFVKALEAFDAAKTPEDFRGVAAAFEALVSPEYRNDALQYNIGNARMKAGDYGRAILAYRKAKLFRPRDPWLEANLLQALSAAPGRVPDEPEPLWRRVFFWSAWLSVPEKFHLMLGIWAASVLLVTAALVWRSGRLRWAGLAVGVIAVLFSIDAALASGELNHSRRAVVVNETIARKGNGTNWEPAFDQPLKDGAEFTIMERRGDWVLGHFYSIGDAWLPEKSIAE